MSLNKNWVLQVDHAVYKFLKKIPRSDAERILFVIEIELPINPFAADMQKMEGEQNVWRRRVGSYRIKFEVIKNDKIIHVFRAERRTSKTY
ncbi:MAG: hypothetical protein A3G49_01010 [Candidatus Sungbacteria bacterium RIFCSPLOWO2_12_FULL_41_11]|uniref:Plasmid stabilization protein n=1 Tax=Candidatus Sungbacteria bacterium RIFCSPLOWO2_12_FULL_41_11 TaxID=1802286 RepID=A0A1G2LQZ9_9BACT|nr:MAG: hypothetical protein A3G49_01010 [Candidatus Sungbacteria bacterium RIFCSPLOWO2_12_FULL_41_11]